MIVDLEKFDWDNVKASGGGFQKLPAGAYICEIKHVDEVKTRDRGTQIVLSVDISEGEFAGYFENRLAVTGSWDFNAQLKRYVYDVEKKRGAAGFKGVITTLEQCNPNFKFLTNPNTNRLAGLKVGGVFGEREYLDKKTNEIKTSTNLKWFCNIQDVKEGKVKIPPLEKLPDDKRPNNSADISGFNGQDVPDDDIPF